MAVKDLIRYAGNDKKNTNTAVVGCIGMELPDGSGDALVAGSYKIASIPANSLITNIKLVVETAFDGTTPTVDIGIAESGATLGNDLDISATGVVDGIGYPLHVTSLTDIIVTPTLGGSTVGDLRVVVECVELNAYEGTFTE